MDKTKFKTWHTSIKPHRMSNGDIAFSDHPNFRPNLTPKQMFDQGIMYNGYYREIYSKVAGKWLNNAWKEFPKSWFKTKPNVPENEWDKSMNRYNITACTSLKFWESKGWIKAPDYYGWVQWYCRFYLGRRSDDDDRQINRWMRLAGPNGRFRTRLINECKKRRTSYNDESVFPRIRQVLLTWGFELKRRHMNL